MTNRRRHASVFSDAWLDQEPAVWVGLTFNLSQQTNTASSEHMLIELVNSLPGENVFFNDQEFVCIHF